MTVLFAFTWPEKKVCFLGADDLEGSEKRIHDKGLFGQNRFLVGCVGNNVVLEAANAACALGSEDTVLRDMTRYLPPKTVDEYCQCICIALPMIAPYRDQALTRAVDSGNMPLAQKRFVESQSGTLVIVDVCEYTVSVASFGKILPARSSYTCEITRLAPGRVHRFGIDAPADIGPVTKGIIENPFVWCADRVRDSRVLVESKGFIGAIGELGGCWFVRGGRVRRRTASTSLKDAMSKLYPPFDG